MAAYWNLSTFAGQQSSDAELRAIATWQDTALLTGGWVQAGDSGQADPATLVRNETQNTSVGFRIYRMGDSLNGTAPIFMKLEWGTGGSANTFTNWITVGKGSNGSGTITGTLFSRVQIATGNVVNAGSAKHAISADTARWTFAFNYNVLGSCQFFSIEREKSALGADVGTGFYATYRNGGSINANGGLRQWYAEYATAVTVDEQEPGIIAPLVGTGVQGADVFVYPQYHSREFFKPFGLNQLGYFHSSIAAESEIVFNLYGASRTYFTLGNTFVTTATVASRGGPAGFTLMVRKV